MYFRRFGLIFLSLLFSCNLFAQYLSPVTRLHATDVTGRYYGDNLLSGFVQGADADVRYGFLQMPFVGDPLLIYVGEKDSTQYTAYASNFVKQQTTLPAGQYLFGIERYGVTAFLQEYPAYTLQEYEYPDTLADKGFLLDLDHSGVGVGRDDMEVEFVDKYTLRATKRVKSNGVERQSFYYAHFSHPFSTWNVRRECVKLENGQKEGRCKVALTFGLKPKEKLIVASSVSMLGQDEAAARLDGHIPARHPEYTERRVARTLYCMEATSQSSSSSTRKSYSKAKAVSAVKTPLKSRTSSVGTGVAQDPADWVEVVTRDAELRAAFYSAMSELKKLPECQQAKGADEFFEAITPLYFRSAHAEADEEQTDSLLRSYAQNLFSSNSCGRQIERDAWLVFNALGFRPIAGGQGYQMVRPFFNVETLYLSNGRRLMIHVKNNSLKNKYVYQMNLMHQEMPSHHQFTHGQLLRGGMMGIKMAHTK